MEAQTPSKTAVMQAAWKLFREVYGFGPREKGGRGMSFSSIGRHCFGWCLAKAWADANHRARIAAIPAPIKAARVEAIRAELRDMLTYCAGSFKEAQRHESRLESEMRELLAA